MNSVEMMEKVDEALGLRELDFTARMVETYALVDGVYVPTRMYTPIRDDKEGIASIIHGKSFTDKYHPIQHTDAFKVLGEMTEIADVEFEKVGCWGNGAGVFAQVSLGSSMEIGGSGDKVGRWLSVVNSHDGTRALQILVTPYRFFCRNQIAKAIRHAKDSNRIISINHNSQGQGRLNELVRAVAIANDEFRASEDAYNRLADRMISMDEAREAMARCYPIPVYKDVGTPEKTRVRWEKMVVNLIENFKRADDGRIEVMTGWNLYNAIQGTYQHGVKKTSAYEKSLILGNIALQAHKSLGVVQDILFGGGMTKTEHPEFDSIFRNVA